MCYNTVKHKFELEFIGEMKKRMRFITALLYILMGLVFICLFISVCYLINGSLEMFPTEEKQDGVRTVALFLLVIFTSIEVLLIMIIKRIKKHSKK